ncbi:SGNH/GDSL hydrolase family protein [Vagococcus sp.]|uniref:SGNH/GDSL hydrolase family protein n=1 Tax=Vagococcus sp. TaxID=1933889 RepID=UPI003F9794A6
MKQFKKIVPFIIFFVVVSMLTKLMLSLSIPKADDIKRTTLVKKEEPRREILRLHALGDSLTEGIGDSTNSGGYVPILQRDLADRLNVDVVEADNFGKSGDRSDQILKRLKKQTELQKSIEKADVILLTVGGNDLLQSIGSKMFGTFSIKAFDKPLKKYETNLEKLYEKMREYNKNAPIFQLGVYNPFYKNFSEITEMQEIVDYWNDGSKQVISKQKNAYFVPINDEIYNGLDNKATLTKDEKEETTTSTSISDAEIINNLLSEEDNFHPNNLGYQIVANVFKEKMLANKNEWFSEDKNEK